MQQGVAPSGASLHLAATSKRGKRGQIGSKICARCPRHYFLSVLVGCSFLPFFSFFATCALLVDVTSARVSTCSCGNVSRTGPANRSPLAASTSVGLTANRMRNGERLGGLEPLRFLEFFRHVVSPARFDLARTPGLYL